MQTLSKISSWLGWNRKMEFLWWHNSSSTTSQCGKDTWSFKLSRIPFKNHRTKPYWNGDSNHRSCFLRIFFLTAFFFFLLLFEEGLVRVYFRYSYLLHQFWCEVPNNLSTKIRKESRSLVDYNIVLSCVTYALLSQNSQIILTKSATVISVIMICKTKASLLVTIL